jgi:DNA-binding response OmpR family regulator
VLLLLASEKRAQRAAYVLRRAGCRVTVAANVDDALSSTDHFDIGIFDLEAPRGNPIVAAAALLAADRLGQVEFLPPLRQHAHALERAVLSLCA